MEIYGKDVHAKKRFWVVIDEAVDEVAAIQHALALFDANASTGRRKDLGGSAENRVLGRIWT